MVRLLNDDWTSGRDFFFYNWLFRNFSTFFVINWRTLFCLFKQNKLLFGKSYMRDVYWLCNRNQFSSFMVLLCIYSILKWNGLNFKCRQFCCRFRQLPYKEIILKFLILVPIVCNVFFFPSKILLIQLLNYRLVEIGFRLGAQKDRWSRPSSTRAHSTAMKELLPRHPVGIRLTWAPRARICGLSLVPCRNLYPKRLSHYSGK